MEVVASLSQGRTAAAQFGLFTHKSVPVIFEPPCTHISNSMIVRPAVAELFHVDEQTHRQMDRLDEINGLFSQLFKRT